MCLHLCSPPHDYSIPELRGVITPLNAEVWMTHLASHPDRAFVTYISNGLREGFRIGFRWQSPLAAATSNKPSATLRPSVVSDYIAAELGKGCMLGPFPLS